MAKQKVAKVKAVKAKRLGRYTDYDIKAIGPMPEWDDMVQLTAEQHKARWYAGSNFYRYHHDIKELRPFIVAYFDPIWTKEQKKLWNKVKDWQISPQVGAYCKMLLDGAKWIEDSKTWTENHLAMLFDKAKLEVEVAEVVAAPKKVSVQDHMADLRDEAIGELELYEDKLLVERQLPKLNVLAWLRAKNVPQQTIPFMIDFYGRRLAFMLEAREGKDAQLKEAFASFKKKDWDMWIQWYNDVITDLDAYKRVKVAARKTRVKKIVPPEKLVRKMKYMKKFEELGLTSINPVDVVHAAQLWVYNTKTRKLFRYVASDIDKELSVKGSTLLGWDAKNSVGKTLRKPKEQLVEFSKSGRVQLRTFLDKIKAVEVKANGRINDQMILLRADR